MTTYKRQIKDKDGNVIYPDVGIPLDTAVYSETPGSEEAPTGWVNTTDIADEAVNSDKIDLSSVFGASMRSSSYTLTTSDTTIASVDISNFPTGSVVAVFGTLNTQNSIETAIYGNIKDNSNTVLATGTCYLNASGAQSLSLQGVFTKTSTQTTVNLMVAKSNSSSSSTISAKNASVTAIVVGKTS